MHTEYFYHRDIDRSPVPKERVRARDTLFKRYQEMTATDS